MPASQPFVAREKVISELLAHLDGVQAGDGKVFFLSGDAGTGKTTLARAFIERAQAAHPDLVAALGTCETQTGVGDPYLPFREILRQFTGEADETKPSSTLTAASADRLKKLVSVSGEALVELGPDLIGVFVPGAGLVARALTFLAEKRGWMDRFQQLTERNRQRLQAEELAVDQAHIFEQYLNVIKKLADTSPLVLVLDDLQWADQGSLDLMFYLGRRIGASPILILGSYRPADVALGRLAPHSQQTIRHPMEKVLAEFKRYHGDITLDLNEAAESGGREFVNAFLDTEPNHLGATFRNALYRHTGGHPLFTVELVRALQDRGVLARDDSGAWKMIGRIDWTALPDKVEGVIEERIGRLEEDLGEILRLGSVEGESFTAEIVAELRSTEVRGIIRGLSGALEKKHRLVVSEGVTPIPGPVRRLSRFRFSHNLFRSFVYNRLSEAERAYLHEDIGLLLEEFYGEDGPEIALSLAYHFYTAGNKDKAVRYLALAGNQAMLNYANQEALRLFSRALEVADPSDSDRIYDLRVKRQRIYHWEGMRSEQEAELEILQRLADQSGEREKTGEVAYLWSTLFSNTSRFDETEEKARQAVEEASPGSEIAIRARIQLGHVAYWHKGNGEEAARYLNQAFEAAVENNRTRVAGVALNELAILSAISGDYSAAEEDWKRGLKYASEADARRLANSMRTNLGRLYNEIGRADLAEPILLLGLADSRRMGARRTESNILNALLMTGELKGDFAQAIEYGAQALEICEEIDNRGNVGFINGNIGNLKMKFGDLDAAARHFETAIQIGVEIDSKRVQSLNLSNRAKLLYYQGEFEQCLEVIVDGLAMADEMEDRLGRAYTLLWQGSSLTELGRVEEADEALLELLALRREFKQPGCIADALAVLLRNAERAGDADKIAEFRDDLLAQIEETPDLPLSQDPLKVYLDCIEHLKRAGDPRARALLEQAFTMLRERALKIGDRRMRRAFLEDVPVNRKIIRMYG